RAVGNQREADRCPDQRPRERRQGLVKARQRRNDGTGPAAVHPESLPVAVALGDDEQNIASGRIEKPETRPGPKAQAMALTISSHIFLASPSSIIVFGRKNSSLSTPA